RRSRVPPPRRGGTRGWRAGSRAELGEELVLEREVDRALEKAGGLIPLPGVVQARRERIARANAQLHAQLVGGVDGVTVVDEVLAEDGSRLVRGLEQRGVDVAGCHRLAHDLGDQ